MAFEPVRQTKKDGLSHQRLGSEGKRRWANGCNSGVDRPIVRAVHHDPASWSYLETLGATQYRQGEYQLALDTLRTSQSIQNQPPEAPADEDQPADDLDQADQTSYWTRCFLVLDLAQLGPIEEAQQEFDLLPKDTDALEEWTDRMIVTTLGKEIKGILPPAQPPPASERPDFP